MEKEKFKGFLKEAGELLKLAGIFAIVCGMIWFANTFAVKEEADAGCDCDCGCKYCDVQTYEDSQEYDMD